MQGRCRGSDVFQIAENAVRPKQVVHLSVERSLPFVEHVVNSETRDDGVKPAEVGQRTVQVMLDDGNRGIEILARGLQHDGRKVHRHGLGARPVELEEPEQPPVATPQVEDAAHCGRHAVEQHRLSFRPVGDGIGLLQVVEGVLGR